MLCSNGYASLRVMIIIAQPWLCNPPRYPEMRLHALSHPRDILESLSRRFVIEIIKGGLSLRAGHVAPVSWFINEAGWHGGEITVANDSNRPRRSLVENPGMKNESRRGGIKLPETRCSPVPTYQREHASPGQLINDPYSLWIFIRRGVNERKTALVERDDWRLAVLLWNICSEEARKLIITPRVMILARIQSYEELI